MPWWQIVAILVAFAVVTGLIVGLLAAVLGFPGSWGTVGVGAATGVVAVGLISHRKRAQGPAS
jgi:hypothetical protein